MEGKVGKVAGVGSCWALDVRLGGASCLHEGCKGGLVPSERQAVNKAGIRGSAGRELHVHWPCQRASRESEVGGFGEKEGRQFVSVAQLKSRGQKAWGF